MMRTLLILLCIAPFGLVAQDFTREDTETKASSENSQHATLLILPYHPHYHISEVDRMMCPPEMDVMKMRKKLRSAVTRSVAEAFSDSIYTVDLSISSGIEKIDLEEYLYNALDYHYVKIEPESEKKKRFAIGLSVRKEQKIYGARSSRREGQLDRDEILHDRFMTATVAETAATEYLQDIYGHEHLLAVSQLEITRNLDDIHAGEYICSLHVSLIDRDGDAIDGYKEVMNLQASQLSLVAFKEVVLPAMAQNIVKRFWSKMTIVEQLSGDNSDY